MTRSGRRGRLLLLDLLLCGGVLLLTLPWWSPGVWWSSARLS
ncbi:hypothetical protein AB0J86_34350 [Micromonospora sp. NPDC049559]